MTYCYRCITCKRTFDIVKSVKDIDVTEYCPRCGDPGERMFVPENLYFSKTKVTHAEYNPGLGQVIHNEREKDYVMKKKGLVEIGNDFGSGEKMQDTFDKDRERKFKKRWDEAL